MNCLNFCIINIPGDTEAMCRFTDSDPYGILMSIIGMGIVFSVLLLIFVIFSNTPKLFDKEFKVSFGKKKEVGEAIEDKTEIGLSGEVSSAIAMALYLYRAEMHDEENAVLTIKKVTRTYSPWSSKIYGLRNMPK